MIDDIVEMIFKEARARDRKNLFASIFIIITEVMDKCNLIAVEHYIEERRINEHENKG